MFVQESLPETNDVSGIINLSLIDRLNLITLSLCLVNIFTINSAYIVKIVSFFVPFSRVLSCRFQAQKLRSHRKVIKCQSSLCKVNIYSSLSELLKLFSEEQWLCCLISIANTDGRFIRLLSL